MLKKLKKYIKMKCKRLKLKIIINKRIILCRNDPTYSNNYVNCCRCKYTQRCYKKYINRVKWII